MISLARKGWGGEKKSIPAPITKRPHTTLELEIGTKKSWGGGTYGWTQFDGTFRLIVSTIL